MARIPLSVQLYTLREQVAKDFAGVVREIGKIGYQGVELAGYGNLKSAQEVKKACAEAGVQISGNHVMLDVLEKDAAKAVEENAVFGLKRLVVPWLAEERRKTAADWKKVAASMNKVGKELKSRGVELLYHNHSFEFDKLDNGQTGMEILFGETDPELVKSELDVYWVQHGGQDPAAYIAKLGKRCVFLHLKDMAAGPERKFAEVGTGILDFPAILAAGQKAGVAWYVVEQDNCYGKDPLQAVRTSFENLKRLGAA